MTHLKFTKEEIKSYDFFKAWKTDDKEWMKNRRKQWLEIKSSLDQIAAVSYGGLKKKDYKPLKNYFMTGYPEPITEEEISEWEYNKQPCCFQLYDILGKGVFVYWLSPDHSPDNWERIKCAIIYQFRHNVSINHPSSHELEWFYETCTFFRETTRFYPRVELYQTKSSSIFKARFSPYNDCKAIFGDELQAFLATALKVEETEGGLPTTFNHSKLLSIFTYYLRGDEFNPSNPVRYFVDEYLRWGLNKNIENRIHDYEADLVALIWYVVDNPEGKHPFQLQVAKELKQGILEGENKWNAMTKKSISAGITMFETGIEEAFHRNDPDLIKQNYFKFRQKHFGHTF